VLATPMQLAVATMALANDGVMYKPQLIRAWRDPVTGKMGYAAPQVAGRIKLTPKFLSLVKEAMVDVTRPGGTASIAGANTPYLFAGKTGTAQVVGIKQGAKYVESQVAARNLALARDNNPLMTLCSGCYSTFREAQHSLMNDPVSLQKVNHTLEQVGHHYSPGAPVEHFARFLYEKVGVDEFSARVTRSWNGMPIAVHNGCHFLRPSHIIGFDDPENPTRLEELVTALGATVVDYPRKMLCCGFPVQGVDPALSLRMAYEKLMLMSAYGARAVVVVCPSCYLQFDLLQSAMEREFGEAVRLPVLYLTEAIGLALGFTPTSLGLNFHRVDTLSLLQEVFPGENG